MTKQVFQQSVKIIIIFIAIISIAGCTSAVRLSSNAGKITRAGFTTGKGDYSFELRGLASYYDDKFDGLATSSGEIFDQRKLTAAHKSLPFGTKVRVTNLNNKKNVIVVINDRGPFVEGRIIDLSRAAAEQLGMIDKGVVEVELQLIE